MKSSKEILIILFKDCIIITGPIGIIPRVPNHLSIIPILPKDYVEAEEIIQAFRMNYALDFAQHGITMSTKILTRITKEEYEWVNDVQFDPYEERPSIFNYLHPQNRKRRLAKLFAAILGK